MKFLYPKIRKSKKILYSFYLPLSEMVKQDRLDVSNIPVFPQDFGVVFVVARLMASISELSRLLI